MRHRQLEVEVPLEHATDIGHLAGHLERLHQELGLLLLGDVLAVLIAKWRELIRAIAELGQPDLLGSVAILDHRVAVFADAGEGEEAVVAVEATGQAALGRGGRAVGRVGKAARVSRQRVEVADHLATIDGVQLLEIAQVVDDRARDIGAGRAGRSEQHHCGRIAGFDAGVARLEYRQVGHRIDVARPGLTIEVLFVPQLVRLDLARIARGDRLHELAERARIGRHQATGISPIKGRRMGKAEHDAQPGFGSITHDFVELRPVVLADVCLD